MAGDRITDLRHLIGPDGDIASFRGGRQLAQHLCQIVSAVTSQAAEGLLDTSLACRRRPGRKPCPGQIQAGFDEASGRIRWLCPSCGARGWISGWQGTRWDKGERVGLPSIGRITYRGGLVPAGADIDSLPVTVVEGPEMSRELLVAIHDNALIGISGRFGDAGIGRPLQYDELTIEHGGRTDTMVVFNRAIMLLSTDDDFLRRFHRVVYIIEETQRPDKP
jgi:hypothetical protein